MIEFISCARRRRSCCYCLEQLKRRDSGKIIKEIVIHICQREKMQEEHEQNVVEWTKTRRVMLIRRVNPAGI
jgi:hypothetical protein